MEITKQNYEEHALDYIEGTLTAEKREAFERFLAEDPAAAKQIQALQDRWPVLAPDLSVRLRDKSALRRKAPMRMLYLRIASAAAVLLAVVLLFDRLRPDGAEQPSAPLTADAVPAPGQVQPQAFQPLAEAESRPAPQPEKRAATVSASNSSMPVQPVRKETQQPRTEEVTIAGEPAVVPDKITPVTAGISLKPRPEAPAERVVSVTQEYVIERTNEPVVLAASTETPLEKSNQAGFLNVLSVRGFRSFASKVIAPLGEISPIQVDENNEERVIRFASIPVSRRAKPEQENQ